MPTATFWNLPAAKRDDLLAVAVDAFAEADYAAVSVERLAARAGIAKGSLYQYFADKRELYLFVLDYANTTRLDWVTQHATITPGDDVWTTLRRQARLSAAAALAFPQLTRLFLRAVAAAGPVRDDALARMQHLSLTHWLGVVSDARARGELRTDIDAELMARLLDAAFGALGRVVQEQLALDAQALAAADLAVFGDERVDHLCDQLIQLLHHGLAPAQEPS